jgi:hypothetical protein
MAAVMLEENAGGIDDVNTHCLLSVIQNPLHTFKRSRFQTADDVPGELIARLVLTTEYLFPKNKGGSGAMTTLNERNRNAGTNLILEQLEERIVLDGAAEAKDVDMMDGQWHDLGDGTRYMYHSDLKWGEWWLDDSTGIGYEYETGNWGIRDGSGWDLLHSSTADSTAFYDGQWIDLYNGQWFMLQADRYAYFWSDKAGYEAYFCYDYDDGQWWQDTNGYYVSGGWTTFDDPGTATDFDDFIYDGVWYQRTNHQWFILQDGVYGYWWSDYGGTESYFCYDYDAEQWWRDDDGDYLTIGPWSMFPNAGFGSQFVYDSDEYARSAEVVYWLEDSLYGYWEYDNGTDVQLFCYDNDTGQWWQDIDGLRGTADWVTYGDPGASPTPPFDYPNDPPENSLPDTQFMVEDTTLVFSASNGNAITVSDPDVGADTLQVALTVDDGTLSLGGTDGLTFVAGADGTSSMTFEGSTEDINSALDGLAFSPTADFNRTTALHITTSDLGHVGTGGTQSDTDGLLIYVQPVNDGPPTTSGIADITVEEDAPDTVFSLWPLFTDDDDPSYTLSYSVTGNTNPGLFSSVDITDPTNFTLAYAPNAHGTSQITIRATDTDGLRIETTFTVTVNQVLGEFTDSGQSLGSFNTESVALGDVDGDGDLDVVEGNFSEGNRIWINDGSGTFTDSGQSLGSFTTFSLALGDIDGDGDLDIVEGNYHCEGNRIWINDGSGTFTDSGQSLGSYFTYLVALGDVDGDGDLDIVAGNSQLEGNRIWINDGSGTFTDSGQSLGSFKTFSLALGDIDGDGDLDIVAGNDNDGNRIWINDGSGTFSDSGQSLGSYDTDSLALGDIDGDGDLDIVEGNDGQRNRIWTNDGSGTFSDSGQSLGSYYTQSIALGDVDGDGDLDIVAGNYDGNRIWINDGSGTFTDSGQSLDNYETQSVALGDVDGDGDLDIVAGNFGQGNRIYLND